MKKIFIVILISLGLQAQNINSVVASVDNDAITSYDVTQIQNTNLSTKQKIDLLINKKIEAKLVKKFNIVISDDEVDRYIKYQAELRGMSEVAYINQITSSGITFSDAYEEFRNILATKKLYQQIVQSNHNVNEQEVIEYYENNKQLFTMPSKISTRVYVSSTSDELSKKRQMPMYVSDAIQVTDAVLDINSTDKKLFEFLLQTKNKTFTQIINLNSNWTMFYVNDKYGESYVPYEKIKDIIMQKVIESKTKQIIGEFIQNYKNNLNIKYIKGN